MLQVFIHASYVGAFENWYSSLNRSDFWLKWISKLLNVPNTWLFVSNSVSSERICFGDCIIYCDFADTLR